MLLGCHQFRECVPQVVKKSDIETLTVNEIIGRCPNLIIDNPNVILTGNLEVCNGNVILQTINACSNEFPIVVNGNVVFEDNVSIEGTLFVCNIAPGENCNSISFCDGPISVVQMEACPNTNGIIVNTNVIILGNLDVCQIRGELCNGNAITIGPNVIIEDTLFVCNISPGPGCNSIGFCSNAISIGQIDACPNTNGVIVNTNLTVTGNLDVCQIRGDLCNSNAITLGPNVIIEDTLFVCNIAPGPGCNSIGFCSNSIALLQIDACPNTNGIIVNTNAEVTQNLTVDNTLFVCNIAAPANCNSIGFCSNVSLLRVNACPNNNSIILNTNIEVTQNLTVDNTLFVCNIAAPANCNSIGFCSNVSLLRINACPNNTSVIVNTNIVTNNNVDICGNGVLTVSRIDACNTNIDILNSATTPLGQTGNLNICGPTTVHVNLVSACSNLQTANSATFFLRDVAVGLNAPAQGGNGNNFTVTPVNFLLNGTRALHTERLRSWSRIFTNSVFSIPGNTWTTVPIDQFFSVYNNLGSGSGNQIYAGGTAWANGVTFQLFQPNIINPTPITYGSNIATWGGAIDPFLLNLLTLSGAGPAGEQERFVCGMLINLSSLDNPYAFLRPLEYRGFASWGTTGNVITDTGVRAMRYILYNAAPQGGGINRFYGPTWTFNSRPLFQANSQSRITSFTDFNELTGTAANIGVVLPYNAKWAVQLQVWSDSDSFIPLNDGANDECSLSINTWA